MWKFLLCLGAWLASGWVFTELFIHANEWIATLFFTVPILLTAWVLGSGEPRDERRVLPDHTEKPAL